MGERHSASTNADTIAIADAGVAAGKPGRVTARYICIPDNDTNPAMNLTTLLRGAQRLTHAPSNDLHSQVRRENNQSHDSLITNCRSTSTDFLTRIACRGQMQ